MCKNPFSEWIVKSGEEAQEITGHNSPFTRVKAKLQTPGNSKGEEVTGWLADGDSCSQIFIRHNHSYQERGDFWLDDIALL